MQLGPALPAASVHRLTRAQRLIARLKQPPAWAAGPSRWALSAAAFALLLHLVTVLARDGRLHLLYEVGRTPSNAALTLFVFSLALMPMFAMLRFSGALYFVLLCRRTAGSGVAWTTFFHACAHMAVLGFLRAEPFAAIHVPILVGVVWGLWLPRVHDGDSDAERRSCYLGTWTKP